MNFLKMKILHKKIICYTEETLKSQHYLVEEANISELCVKYNLQDLRKGVVLPFVGDREACNIDNFKK